jgi:hypothetical protein
MEFPAIFLRPPEIGSALQAIHINRVTGVFFMKLEPVRLSLNSDATESAGQHLPV